MIIKLKDMKEKCDEKIAQANREILFQEAKKQVIDEILVDLIEQEKEKCVCENTELVEEPIGENLVEEPVVETVIY
jgi:hypothetical protein